jgi:hypothetical protein
MADPTPEVRAAARTLVAKMIESAYLSDGQLPHLVLITDPGTGTRTGYGPLPDAWMAVEVALGLVAYHQRESGPPDMAWEIVPWFELDDRWRQ